MARRAVTPQVLVLTPDFPPSCGGIQLLMARFVELWSRCHVRVVTLGRDDGRKRIRRAPTPPVGGRRAAVASVNAFGVAEGLCRRPDVVFSGHIVVGPGARVVQRLSGARYAQYVHGMELPARPKLAAACLRSADRVIANSRYTAELALAHDADPGRLCCIAPGVDVPPPTQDDRFQRPTVVVVSRLDERYKGHDVLIRALPLIRARVPGARLIVVGDGRLRPAYEGLARALALDGAVEFTGAVEDTERDRILARSHVFAMPSRLSVDGGGEGFGIAYLEAGAHGLPVVGGDVAGARDAVVNGKTGLLVDPSDHVAVADAIAGLLVERERAEALGRAGAKRAREFAWPKIAAQVEDVVLELANQLG